jgi:peptidoglycan/xylan/chitin deacetylase (PgdA/CDA1 family)
MRKWNGSQTAILAGAGILLLLLATVLAVTLFSSSASAPKSTTTAALTLTSIPTASSTAASTPTPTSTPTATATPEPPAAARVPIIEYHYTFYRLTNEIYMTADWFEDQMAWLEDNGYHTLTAEELVRFLDGERIPGPAVVLTFDIGTEHRVDFAGKIIPALRSHHLHAIFFVVTGMILDTCDDPDVQCWDELNGWADEGLISIASHGVNHPDYAKITTADQRWDAGTSKSIIEEKTGRPALGFAFPYDSYDASALNVIESLGYRFGLAGNSRLERYVSPEDPERYSLPRIYPYSNPDIYPVIYGSGGLTFPQLMAENSTVAEPAEIPSTLAAETPAPASASEVQTPAPTAAFDSTQYYRDCMKISGIQNAMDYLLGLDQLSFPADLSSEAQALLEKPLTVLPSCNTERGNQPRAIVLHATRAELGPTLSEFRRLAGASAHYVIDRDGQVYQLIPETLAAYHVSCFGSRAYCVASCPVCDTPEGIFREPYLQSVGIEMINLGQIVNPAGFGGMLYEDYLMSYGFRFWEDYPEAQLESLRVLVEDIRSRWGIPYSMVIGHYRINEKTDPGPALNLFWERNGDPPRPPVFSTPEP